jgi:small-conductance mechanosensitive channel
MPLQSRTSMRAPLAHLAFVTVAGLATLPSQAVAQITAAPEAETGFAVVFDTMRRHIAELAGAVPGIPGELTRVAKAIGSEMYSYGPVQFVLLFAVFVAAGFAARWIFWRFSSGVRAWIAATRLETISDRLIVIVARLAYSAASPLAFALGSIGAFLAFDWPPLLGQIMLGCLLAIFAYRLAKVMLEFLLSPAGLPGFGESARFRVLPVSDAAAAFWVDWLAYAAGWLAFGAVSVNLLASLGSPLPLRQLVAYALGTVLLVLGIQAVWRRPAEQAVAATQVWVGARAKSWLLSTCFGLLWLLWVGGAMKLFWLLAVMVGLPAACLLAEHAVNNIFRPPGTPPSGKDVPSVLAAVVERGVRAALVIGAVIFLAGKLGVDFTLITAQDTILTRIIRGGLSAIVILLAADFLWHVTKTIIDKRLADAAQPEEPGTEAARRNARLRTLLPIVRNVMKIVILLVALLMALSSLGVEIGPLIAGAGIFGVAIGFGAQTVVKDIISGVFYLLDDAFRVGEYIQSGSYKGTVESFSLRSVMLRHHRGSIYTVPFSDLGAIQNMSRDWVIEKIAISVTYDSDVAKARQIVKAIGQDLAKDPEFAASTIEPLKMQGVDEFGESGMLLRLKMKTRPGEQFGIKRRALMLIKQAFDENGIKLAVPMVQVSGDDVPKVAAAQQRRIRQRAKAALAAAE